MYLDILIIIINTAVRIFVCNSITTQWINKFQQHFEQIHSMIYPEIAHGLYLVFNKAATTHY